jgi:hypothetical protein
VDAYAPNEGFPLAFAYTFVATNGPASADLVPATAVVVLRTKDTAVSLKVKISRSNIAHLDYTLISCRNMQLSWSTRGSPPGPDLLQRASANRGTG